MWCSCAIAQNRMKPLSGDNCGFKSFKLIGRNSAWKDWKELKRSVPALFVDAERVCDCDHYSATELSIMRNWSLTCYSLHLGMVHVNAAHKFKTVLEC